MATVCERPRDSARLRLTVMARAKGTTPSAKEAAANRLQSAAAEFEHVDYFQVLLQNKSSKSLRQLWPLLREAFATVWVAARWEFIAASALTIGNAGLAVLQVLLAGRLLSALLRHTHDIHLGPLVPYVIALSCAAAGSLVVANATQQVQRLLGQRVTRHTTRQMLDVTTGVPLDAYETPWFFNYVVRIETNALTKPLEIAQAIVSLLAGVTTAAGVGAVLLTIEPWLLPLLVLTALPAFVAQRLGSKWDFTLAVETSGTIRERMYYEFVMKIRDAAKEIRAYDLAELLRRRWEDRYRDYLAGLRAVVKRRLLLTLGSGAATAAFTTATMVFLLWRVSSGHVALAEAGAALVGLRFMTSRLQTTASGTNSLFECRLFLEDLHNFLTLRELFTVTTEPTAGNGEPPRALDAATDGFARLSVDRVSYTYPGSQVPALRDISLELHQGDVVALVGENGSGKTTLAKLLAGLHAPSSGEIRWDGVPTADIDPRQLRQNIAVIFQDFQHYELSATENIGVGRAHEQLDTNAVVDAAVHAGADSFIAALPNGYETPLSKARAGGVDLSLGQWQRIALARAFYRNAGFVILDEPTSALDPRAEQELFARIRQLLRGRTVLMISHRFSSVRSADYIYVMHEGQLTESGTHEELMAQAGRYYELFTLQAAAYLDAGEYGKSRR